MRARGAWGAVFLVAFGALASVRPAAAAGLDPTFGNGGKTDYVQLSQNDGAKDVALQPDGKLVIAGIIGDDFGVIRYTSDGIVDETFGDHGRVRTDFGDYEEAQGVAVQPDGKILVAGCSGGCLVGSGDVVMARYLPDGELDPTFGAGGKVTTSAGIDDYGSDVLVQPDGKIVVAGESEVRFLVIRYLPDGSLDQSFGEDGIVTAEFGAGALAWAVARQPDGKLVVAGQSGPDVALLRVDANGLPDASFGVGGKVIGPSQTTYRTGQGLALQADGKIVVAGETSEFDCEDFSLFRFKADGSPDQSFAGDGSATINFGDTYERCDVAQDVLVMPDGRIIAVGYSFTGDGAPEFDPPRFALAGLTPSGVLDAAFAPGGKMFSEYGQATSAVRQPDNLVVAAGSLLARYVTLGPATPDVQTPRQGAVFDFTKVAVRGTNADPGTIVRIYEGATKRAQVAAASDGSWSFALSFTEGPHTIGVNAIDSAGRVSPTFTRSFTIDTSGPNTTITSGPSGLVKTATASFKFSSTVAGSTFRCSLDGQPFAACSSPAKYTNLAEGPHRFRVAAVVGTKVDPVPAVRTWVTDALGPEVEIHRPTPGVYVGDLSAALEGAPTVIVLGPTTVLASARDSQSGVAERGFAVDGVAVDPAEISYDPDTELYSFPFRPRSPGDHTIEARARNGSGWVTTASVVVFAVVPSV